MDLVLAIMNVMLESHDQVWSSMLILHQQLEHLAVSLHPYAQSDVQRKLLCTCVCVLAGQLACREGGRLSCRAEFDGPKWQ